MPRTRSKGDHATIGIGIFLFLVSTPAALWRAKGCVLRNRLIIISLSLGALAVSARISVQQILTIAATGLAAIVIVEQMTIRRQLLRNENGGGRQDDHSNRELESSPPVVVGGCLLRQRD